MSNVTDRARNAVIALGLTHPFFLPALALCEIKESATTSTGDPNPTACVNAFGIIRINPDFASTLGDAELAGVMCHEIGHLLLHHHSRIGSRNPRRWFRACDRAWNQSLRDMNVPLPQGAIYPPSGQEKLTAEDLYDVEPEMAEDEQSYNGRALNGCGVEEPGPGDVPADGSAPSAEGQRQEWEQVSSQAQSLARGTQHGETFLQALNIPRPKVPWASLLRSAASRALAAHGRDDQTMTRRHRRSPDNSFLPGWKATRARIAVILDTSGSVTEQQIATAIAEIKALAQVSGIRIFVALHDATCYWYGWVKPNETISGRITGRGGTYATPAYEAVREHAGKVDVVVHMTDGYIENPWPAIPCSRMIIGILGNGAGVSPPASAQVVPVEI